MLWISHQNCRSTYSIKVNSDPWIRVWPDSRLHLTARCVDYVLDQLSVELSRTIADLDMVESVAGKIIYHNQLWTTIHSYRLPLAFKEHVRGNTPARTFSRYVFNSTKMHLMIKKLFLSDGPSEMVLCNYFPRKLNCRKWHTWWQYHTIFGDHIFIIEWMSKKLERNTRASNTLCIWDTC